MFQHPLARLVGLLLLITGCGGTTTDPDPCLEVLRRGDFVPCPAAEEDRCAASRENPTALFDWTLELATAPSGAGGTPMPYTADELVFRRQCLVTELDGGEITVIDAPVADPARLTVQGSGLNVLLAVLNLEMVDTYSLACADPALCDCAPLQDEACNAHPFCLVLNGRQHDTTQRCWLPDAPAACSRGGLTCADTATLAVSPLSVCWELTTDCVPEGWLLVPDDPAEVCRTYQADPACP